MMWPAVTFTLLLTDWIVRTETFTQKVPVGIILDQSAVDVRNTVLKMVEYNNRNRTDTPDNRIVIEEDITTVDMDDSFRLSSTICNQLNKGVFLIMGGSSPKSFNVIQSFSHALHVPYVIYTSNRNQAADGYTYDFSVSPAYIDAIIDIIRFFHWRKIYYLFDSDDGLWQLQRVYEAFRDPKHLLLVDARRVGDPNHVHDLLRRLDRVSRSERKRIVLNFSSTEVYQKILNQIVDVGMNRENYHYLLAGPDIDKLELRSFEFGGVNVTGFRLPLVDHSLASRFQQFMSSSRRDKSVYNLSADEALALDAMLAVLSGLNDLLADEEGVKIFKSTFRRREMYNVDMKGIQCWNRNITPWTHGPAIKRALEKVKISGWTGPIAFDEHGVRQNHTLEILHLTYRSPLKKVGSWSLETGVVSNISGSDFKDAPLPENRTRVVTSIIVRNYSTRSFSESPFMMQKCPSDGNPCTGNAQYEGYCVDLIERIAELVGFPYIIKKVADNTYGKQGKDGSWNGMIGELIRGEADIAVAALSITEVRERVVDFSKPYMDTGTSIMIKKPDKQHGGIFSFKSPLSDDVWLSIVFGFLAVSLVLFLIGRFSPYEWTIEQHRQQQQQPPKEDGTEDVFIAKGSQPDIESGSGCRGKGPSNPFTLANTLWFSLGALMQQGSDISPRSISGRLVGSAWWFFTLIIISSYTANLAAFLTIERMDVKINSADDLVRQTEIRYGTLVNGSTQQLFESTEVTVYKQMWNFMREAQPSVFVSSIDEGVKRVRDSKGKYAFLLDSTMNIYHNQRKPCTTMMVGRNLDVKGYGVATPLGSDLRAPINIAVLQLREVGELHKLERKWWYDKGECGQNIKESKSSSLTLSNVSGIFHILVGGLVLSMVVALLDYCIRMRLRQRNCKTGITSIRFSRKKDRSRERTARSSYRQPTSNVMSGNNGTCPYSREALHSCIDTLDNSL